GACFGGVRSKWRTAGKRGHHDSTRNKPFVCRRLRLRQWWVAPELPPELLRGQTELQPPFPTRPDGGVGAIEFRSSDGWFVVIADQDLRAGPSSYFDPSRLPPRR